MDLETGSNLIYVLIAVFAVILVVYLWAESKNTDPQGFKRATALKLTLSSLFCVVGVLSYYLLRNNSSRSDFFFNMQFLIVCALFCAWVGDFFLQYIRLDNKKYKTGITFFMLAQILLIANQCLLYLVSWQEFVVMAVILFLVLVMMVQQEWKLGKERKILTAYTILLTFMTSKAVVKAVTDTMNKDVSISTLLFAAGAVLFLLSDLFLGIWNYNTNKRVHANLNWITYFSGMMLIALSLNPEYLFSIY